MNLDAYSDNSKSKWTAYCECGNRKTKGATACDRCTYLDGDGSNAIIIDLLRGTDGLSATEVCELAGIRHKTGAVRSLLRLLRLGRVRRYWREDSAREVVQRPFGHARRRIIGGGGGCWVYALDGRTA